MAFMTASLIYSVGKDLAKLSSKYLNISSQATSECLQQHFQRTEGWSSNIQMFIMTKPLKVDSQSITLSITDRPRRFYAPSALIDEHIFYTEEEIISDNENYLILGDPGCGKTTLLKRLTRRLITEEAVNENDVIEAPIVVLARDLHAENTIFGHLCSIFGIESRSFNPAEHKLDLERISNVDRRRERERELRNVWIKNSNNAAKSAAIKAIASRTFALLIDGIDEINADYRTRFDVDLEDILNTCPSLKVICTCRMGDITRAISNVHVLAVQALSDPEIKEIVHLWADKPEKFLDEVQVVPYREVR